MNFQIKNILLGFLIILSLGVFKFQNVIFKPGIGLTNFWDGMGGMGHLASQIDAIREQKVPWIGLFKDTKTTLGFESGIPLTIPLRLFFSLFIPFNLEPDQYYDLSYLIFYVATGFTFYCFLLYLPINWFPAIGLVCLFLQQDFIFIRSEVHAFFFLPFFVFLHIFNALKAAKKPTYPHIALFAFLGVLNFCFNAYYGYFGFFFCMGIFLFFVDFKKINLLKSLLFGAVFSLSLLALLPQIILPIIFKLLNYQQNKTLEIFEVQRQIQDFWNYSLKNPLSLFYSYFSFLNFTNYSNIENDLNNFEQNFHLGVLLPTFAFLNFVTERPPKKSLYWIFLVLFMALFAISPDFKCSLVPLTMKIAPMFRVGYRALIFVNIGMFIIAGLFLNRMWRRTKSNSPIKKLLTLIFLIAVNYDLNEAAFFEPIKGFKLPNTYANRLLAQKPEGLTLFLPLYNANIPPDFSYEYLYLRSAINKRMVNSVLEKSNPHNETINFLSDYLANIDSEKIANLCKNGLKYIYLTKLTAKKSFISDSQEIISKSPHIMSPLKNWITLLEQNIPSILNDDYQKLSQFSELDKIYEDNNVILYEFKKTCTQGDWQDFRTFVLSSTSN